MITQLSHIAIYGMIKVFANSNKKKNNIYLPILSNWKKIWKVEKNIYQDAENLQVDKKLNLKKIGQKIKILKKVEYQYMGLILSLNQKLKNNKRL